MEAYLPVFAIKNAPNQGARVPRIRENVDLRLIYRTTEYISIGFEPGSLDNEGTLRSRCLWSLHNCGNKKKKKKKVKQLASLAEE